MCGVVSSLCVQDAAGRCVRAVLTPLTPAYGVWHSWASALCKGVLPSGLCHQLAYHRSCGPPKSMWWGVGCLVCGSVGLGIVCVGGGVSFVRLANRCQDHRPVSPAVPHADRQLDSVQRPVTQKMRFSACHSQHPMCLV
jgi:hypothetical protein